MKHEKINQYDSPCATDPHYRSIYSHIIFRNWSHFNFDYIPKLIFSPWIFCSFKSCIKQSVRLKVGCKMPWDHEAVIGTCVIYWTRSLGVSLYFLFSCFHFQIALFPGKVCSNISEYEEFETLYKDLSLKDKDFIEGTTGCLYPCTYLEYR